MRFERSESRRCELQSQRWIDCTVVLEKPHSKKRLYLWTQCFIKTVLWNSKRPRSDFSLSLFDARTETYLLQSMTNCFCSSKMSKQRAVAVWLNMGVWYPLSEQIWTCPDPCPLLISKNVPLSEREPMKKTIFSTVHTSGFVEFNLLKALPVFIKCHVAWERAGAERAVKGKWRLTHSAQCSFRSSITTLHYIQLMSTMHSHQCLSLEEPNVRRSEKLLSDNFWICTVVFSSFSKWTCVRNRILWQAARKKKINAYSKWKGTMNVCRKISVSVFQGTLPE